MKLNRQGRDELRAKIVEQLQNVPNGQRVHIDKELLEELLFETIVYNKETGATVKLPFWSGQFLSKIDLSEISFDNVSWLLLSGIGEDTAQEFFDDDSLKEFEKLLNEIESNRQLNAYHVDYSNTNAKIDFLKSFEATHGTKKPQMSGVSFYGVDFSNLDISMFSFIGDSNLGNTGIKVSSLDGLCSGQIMDVSLENIDLSNFVLHARKIIDEETPFVGCCFANSKLNIIYNPEEFELKPGETVRPDFYKSIFAGLLKDGAFDGCYINGKLVHTEEERQTIAQNKRAEYEKMKEDLISQTTSSIEEQVSGFGRK